MPMMVSRVFRFVGSRISQSGFSMFDMEAMSPSMAILNYKWLQSIKYSITLC